MSSVLWDLVWDGCMQATCPPWIMVLVFAVNYLLPSRFVSCTRGAVRLCISVNTYSVDTAPEGALDPANNIEYPNLNL